MLVGSADIFIFLQGCSLGKQRGDDERGEGSEKASSADRQMDRQTGIAFTTSGLSSRCYAGTDDSSSSLLGGRFSMYVGAFLGVHGSVDKVLGLRAAVAAAARRL